MLPSHFLARDAAILRLLGRCAWEGTVIGSEALISQIFNVIRVLVDSTSKTYRKLVRSSLSDLVFYAMSYGQMTVDQVREHALNTGP